MAAPIQQLRTLVASLKGRLEVERRARYIDYIATAPHGYVWAANGCHQILECSARGNPEWQESAIDLTLEAVRMGIEPCDLTDCETCNPTT